jgi:hypothetical protein
MIPADADGKILVLKLWGTREHEGKRIREWRAQSPGACSIAPIASLEGPVAPKKHRRNSSDSTIAVSIPEHLFLSPAFRDLPVLERYLLIELLAVAERIGTDEPLRVSVQTAANMCGVSKRHGTRAMAMLEAKEFLVRIRRGEGRPHGKGFSSTWRITCLPFQGEWATRIQPRPRPIAQSEDRGRSKGRNEVPDA